jgi:hypothetical protein
VLLLWSAVLALSALMAVIEPLPLHAADKPTILRRTLSITPWRFTSYWKDKNASEPLWDTWSWVPRLSFQVLGPVAGGSQFSVEYTMPNGKKWMEVDLPTDEIAEGYYSKIETPSGGAPRDRLEKEATLETGVFTFKIKLNNELLDQHDVLMTGRFKVTRAHKGIDRFPNTFEYSIDEDWRMPIGWLWLDPATDERTPYLKVGMWLRGQWQGGDLAGYLMKDGKQIASTKEQYGGSGPDVTLTTIDGAAEDPTWNLWEFEWRGIMGYNHGNTNISDDVYYLDKNPGEYQIKVLYSGKLVRTVTFTVGTDGAIVDNGLVAQNNIAGERMIVPVKISGDYDGKWDKNAWKTEAFYGNPLTGFTAP